MGDKIEYFAYGSNLNTEQMTRRGIDIFDTVKAEIPGWGLAFTIYSENWGGGVADIIPSKGDDKVEGVIYTIDSDDLKKLDRCEGRLVTAERETGTYRRQYVFVKVGDEWRTVFTYVVNRAVELKELFQIPPTRKYMGTIISGAREHGLSEEYIQKLIAVTKMIAVDSRGHSGIYDI